MTQIEDLEEEIFVLQEVIQDLYIDHQALFRCMRSTGQFSLDMFTKKKREILKEIENGE